MEKTKINKKEIAARISESITKTIVSIEKARIGKKLKKLTTRSAKKIALRLVEQLKREEKKSLRAGKSLNKLEGALAGKKDKNKKE